jgi:hypothetical protein
MEYDPRDGEPDELDAGTAPDADRGSPAPPDEADQVAGDADARRLEVRPARRYRRPDKE